MTAGTTARSDDAVSWEFVAIGTQWHIALYGRTDWPAGLQTNVQALIERFDHSYSRFRPDSLVSRMARQAGRYRLPADARPLFDLYYQLYRTTDGRVTPLIGQMLDDAGYDANYRFQPRPLRQPPAWDDALDYAFPYLTLRQPAQLDLGAAGKGYLVDLVSEMLAAGGVAGFVVDAGGDMRHQSIKMADDGGGVMAVGLEKPDATDEVIGIAQLSNRSLCGSAGNRRTWANGAYHHIIDPRRLESPRHLQAVWVCAGSTILADGLTTALYFCPADRLRRQFDFSYALVDADGQLTASPDFPATFFTK